MVNEPDNIQQHPDTYNNTLYDYKTPGAHTLGHTICNFLPECQIFNMVIMPCYRLRFGFFFSACHIVFRVL